MRGKNASEKKESPVLPVRVPLRVPIKLSMLPLVTVRRVFPQQSLRMKISLVSLQRQKKPSLLKKNLSDL